MQSTRLIQIIVVLLTAGLVAFLFFNGRNNSNALVTNSAEKSTVHMSGASPNFNFGLLLADIKAKLPAGDASQIDALEQKVKADAKDAASLELLAKQYETLKQPAAAAYYYQQLADIKPSEQTWFKTGRNYFEAQQLVDDSASFAFFTDKSIKAYESALALNDKNFEAKADLAVNYIEGKGETMKGVGLLREIIQVDPNHRKALFYLGILSIQSNQMDKAVERFEKLISLGPGSDTNYPYYYRYLGQAYLAQGNKSKARMALSQYKAYTETLSDPVMRKEAEEMLKATE